MRTAAALARPIPPCPPEFAEIFIRGGWRDVERHYGARTDLLLKWIEMSGGEKLYRKRREFMRLHGIMPYGGRGGKGGRKKGVDTASWLDR